MGVQAMGKALAGQPVEALRLVAGIRHAASNMSILRSELGFAEAVAHREIGDRERALAELRAIADAPPDLRLYCTVGAMLELALAASDGGDTRAALGNNSPAREHSSPTSTAGRTYGTGSAASVRLSPWAAATSKMPTDGRPPSTTPSGDPSVEPVSSSRTATPPRCEDCWKRPLHVACDTRLCSRCCSPRAAPDSPESMTVVAHAVELASSHGMLQTVASEGRELIEVIERAAWCVPDEWLDRLRLTAAQGKIPRIRGIEGVLRSIDRPRARRAAAPAKSADAQRDRQGVVRVRKHPQVPPSRDLSQARRQQPR